MLYMQIAKDLTQKILNKDYASNNKLPSELDLAKIYNTSKMTIRKSLSILVDSGIIFSIPKSGYYINSYDNIKKFNSLTGNSLSFLNKDACIKSKVIHFELIDIPENVKNKFNSPLKKVYFLKRMKYVDDKLSTIEITYLNYDLFPNFKEDIIKGSIYKYILSEGYLIATNLKTLRANFIPNEFLKLCPALKNKPQIEIENIGYLTTGDVFEYSISYNIDQEFSTFINFNNILKNN